VVASLCPSQQSGGAEETHKLCPVSIVSGGESSSNHSFLEQVCLISVIGPCPSEFSASIEERCGCSASKISKEQKEPLKDKGSKED